MNHALARMNVTPEEFRRRIKDFRDRSGYTQEECANLMGIPWSTWQRWETGKSTPRSKMMVNKLMELRII